MRLWHKDLIDVLPNKQLLGQWRECCAIASNIANKGTPKHLLVDKIMGYDPNHFYAYTALILDEMKERGYKYTSTAYTKFVCNLDKVSKNYLKPLNKDDIFPNWYNRRYLLQCYYNLEEKYDCGGISEEDFMKIHKKVFDVKY